jgi:hypothetical protein
MSCVCRITSLQQGFLCWDMGLSATRYSGNSSITIGKPGLIVFLIYMPDRSRLSQSDFFRKSGIIVHFGDPWIGRRESDVIGDSNACASSIRWSCNGYCRTTLQNTISIRYQAFTRPQHRTPLTLKGTLKGVFAVFERVFSGQRS